MAETLTQRELDEIEVWLHRVEHLYARKGLHGYTDGLLIVDCWTVPLNTVPSWADEAALRGDPPRDWCPILSPHLRERAPGTV